MKPLALRVCCCVGLLALSVSAEKLSADFLVQPGDTVGICGDSITQQKIYSVYIEDYLLMCQPTKNQCVAAFGWSGETAGGFSKRLETDIFPFKPTVATLCYGMNDGGYHPTDAATVETFRKFLTDAVEGLKKGGVRSIVVGTPGAVDPATFKRATATPDQYNEALAALGAAAKEVAEKQGVAFADVHGAMLTAMTKAKEAYGQDYAFAGDGVHPSSNGHLLMAYAFLKGLGCDGAIGTITIDLAANKAEGTPGQEIVSCDKGRIEISSTRYPFCLHGDPAKAENSAASVAKFTSFNQDLNRYLLVVKNLKTAKAKVTWGKGTKEFPAEELAKGINLAAEFIVENPFFDQWDKVNAAVQQQQEMETVLMQQFLHNQSMLSTWVEPDELAKFINGGLARDGKNFNAAAALVVPVKHTIVVEPSS